MTQPERRAQTLPSWIARIGSSSIMGMHPLIQLRWIAVTGQIATIVFVHFVLRVPLPLETMAVIVASLIAFNLASMVRWHDRKDISNRALFFALLVDVFTLTALLHLSGGATNPFIFIYLLQVVVAAVLLKPWASWAIAGITATGFVLLTVWSGPVVLPAHYYWTGLLICFLLDAGLIVIFITRISSILRARDARLALLRQRAVEEEHIVRMGLLASGAAHELGTPLATISVLLGDWRRMPAFREQPALLQDLEEMQLQLDRCKSIVRGILLSAGEMRAESPERSDLGDFLDQLVYNWKATRPAKEFRYARTTGTDLTIVADEGLKQMICNVLDNALEASPWHIEMEAAVDGKDLVIRVLDQGPGFAETMLSHFGRPYQSSKGRPGSGLGLFLSLNVARALGGNIYPQNREGGGAIVTMVLPLSSLTLEEAIDE
jgi:two-component system sensor histidine kinase RegB